MRIQINFRVFCLAATVLTGLCQLSTAAKKPEPLTPQGEKLLATYTTTLEALKKEIVAGIPQLDEKKKVAFSTSHDAIAKLPKLPNPNGLKMAPDGWVTVFGAHWTHNHFRGQCGLDFELESRARKMKEEYDMVHRANWLGDALDEEIVHRMNFSVGGGFWKSLAHYKKLAIVEDAQLKELESVGAEFAESNEPAASPNSDWVEELDEPLKKIEKEFPQVDLSESDKTITTDENGVITIPVAACSKPLNTEKVRFMKSYDDKFVQMHYNLGGNRPELRSYTVELPAAGKYHFTANVVTVTTDRSFTIRANRRNMYEVPLPFTIGEWQETESVVMDLNEGRNKLQFTLKTPNKGVTIKNFTLNPVK